ncbi:helix-turn-helix domain-containing protein [Streptacidiphilus cavernicola]|uniref:Helix-turn-helix domain-containing protein n=1 Tax=Streptacidiphilus cavernicola TaxID=3342716 RepID=A0ABV6W6D5_9ACTN
MASKRVRLVERRKSSGFSKESFAEALHVDRSTVARWERGEAEPQPWHRPKLMKLLDVTAAQLDELLTPDQTLSKNLLVVSPWSAVPSDPASSDEFDALELARRVQATELDRVMSGCSPDSVRVASVVLER